MKVINGHEYTKDRIDLFASLVEVHGYNKCWPWKGHKRGKGYGGFNIRVNGEWKERYAHRIAWHLNFGEIPEGMYICHHCDNPLCCNPWHLFMGTKGDNNRDKGMKKRGRGPIGVDAPLAKLNEDDIRAIRASKRNNYILGEIFGVNNTTISRIKRGITWKHVTPLAAVDAALEEVEDAEAD